MDVRAGTYRDPNMDRVRGYEGAVAEECARLGAALEQLPALRAVVQPFIPPT